MYNMRCQDLTSLQETSSDTCYFLPGWKNRHVPPTVSAPAVIFFTFQARLERLQPSSGMLADYLQPGRRKYRNCFEHDEWQYASDSSCHRYSCSAHICTCSPSDQLYRQRLSHWLSSGLDHRTDVAFRCLGHLRRPDTYH